MTVARAALCSDCLDDEPATKAFLKAQWADAVDAIDAAMSRVDPALRYASLDERIEACYRLAKADPMSTSPRLTDATAHSASEQCGS